MRSSHSTQLCCSLCAARPMTVHAWHRVDVRRWPALARTRITVIGVLDTEAVEAIDDAVESAEAGAYSLTLDLTHIASITPHALSELMTRGYRRTAPAFPNSVPA